MTSIPRSYGADHDFHVLPSVPTDNHPLVAPSVSDIQMQISDVLPELGLRKNQQSSGSVTYVSVVLHHLLKELPIEVIFSNAIEILHLIECSKDKSYDQHMNYRLLGFRLNERRCSYDIPKAVIDKVIQVVEQYDGLHEYLKVVDAYADLILQNRMDNLLNTILEGISRCACKGVTEDEMLSLQNLLVKLLSHFTCLEDVFLLNHFPEILDVTHGSTRNVVFMHILDMATRISNSS
ncbi:hypothetical protein K1719_044764 [Acacia pycnantha]|nr:hypothetical protein K1719_044764 [Acacia pycnantha]